MNKEHVKGAADKAKGSIKEGIGKATGNERLRQGQGIGLHPCQRNQRHRIGRKSLRVGRLCVGIGGSHRRRRLRGIPRLGVRA